MEMYTDDLTLRTVTFADIGEVARTWEPEKGRIFLDEAQKVIDGMQENHKKNVPGRIHHLCLAVFEKGQDKIIGWCGLDGTAAGTLHIFYIIHADHRNRGYATQCARKLLSYAFDEARVPLSTAAAPGTMSHLIRL